MKAEEDLGLPQGPSATTSMPDSRFIQQQSDCNDKSSVTSGIRNPSPTSQSSKNDYRNNDKSCAMEMVPMLQVSQNSNGPVTACISPLNVKDSPNVSHRSEELSVCHHHYSEHANKPNANNQDERMSESQNPLKCNKPNSICSCDHVASNAKKKSCSYRQTQIGCLNHCCGCDSEVVAIQDSDKTIIYYKVLITFIASCLTGILCLLLIVFVSPHLFFKSQSKYHIQSISKS